MAENRLMNFLLDHDLRKSFRKRCLELDVSAGHVLRGLIRDFIDGKVSAAPDETDDHEGR